LWLGIYYPQNSLKAKLCVAGRNQLYEYLRAYNLPHKRCGKLIVCTELADLNRLKAIQQHAHLNGVTSLQLITGSDVRKFYESSVTCEHALWSPDTGIFDTHKYADQLEQDAEQNGCMLAYQCEVQSVSRPQNSSSGWKLTTNQGDIYCKHFINAAGLYAPYVAFNIDAYPKVSI
jgi:L-2-hydroxyglutarate oxidase LhgO